MSEGNDQPAVAASAGGTPSTSSPLGVGGALDSSTSAGRGGSGPQSLDPPSPPKLPSIEQLTPSTLVAGGIVQVSGTDLDANPRLHIAGRTLQPAPAENGSLAFQLPADLQPAACAEQLEVSVETDLGISPPVPLTIERPPIQLAAQSDRVPAGRTLSITGSGLGDAVPRLGDQVLSVSLQTTTNLVVDIPREATPGTRVLTVGSACGEASLPVEVLAPAPRILSVDLQSVAPNGVLLVTADISGGADVVAVHLGSRELSLADATSLRWLDVPASGTRVLALRAPGDLAVGPADLLLNGPTDSSDPHGLIVVAPDLLTPPAMSGIVVNPKLGVAGSFPVATRQPFGQVGATDTADRYWSYHLVFNPPPVDPNLPPLADGATRDCGHGSVSGYERHCPVPYDSDVTGTAPCALVLGCPDTADACFPLSGTWQLNANENHIELTIDRGVPQGPEPYVGGWSKSDETPPEASQPTRLVLRSSRNGLQLGIAHALEQWQGCK